MVRWSNPAGERARDFLQKLRPGGLRSCRTAALGCCNRLQPPSCAWCYGQHEGVELVVQQP
eukprot:11220582-Lingulodinium_polyedra.AAC.1